jgi:endogenous inhibitor of DNA gyrase (YacG/DUF329 family)/type II secretory pathway pseudopilin PulG
VAQTSVNCPECGTEQTSAYGYAPAQTVRCRRCDATFKVPGAKRVTAVAADDDEDTEEQPRSKRWMIGAVALLVLVGLAVVGAMSYVERQRERAEEEQLAAEMAREAAEHQERRAQQARPFPRRGPMKEAGPPLNPFFGPPTAKDLKETTDELSKRLVGVWRAGGSEPVREVEYRADGTFRDGPLEGTWKAAGVSGSKVLKVERSAGRSPVRVTFEGDELLHDGDEPGVSLVLRKK